MNINPSLWIFLLACTPAISIANECVPAPSNVATLKQIMPNFYSVDGPLAEFDPCHKSVKLAQPGFSKSAPLMIVVHGGGGVGLAESNAAAAFLGKGFATLIFDAYQLNGFNQGREFWGSKASNEARQRMIYKATLGAYQWAIKQDKFDKTQIYFHGLSNGANVLANMAGAVSSDHVKGIFAEGTPGMGLGLPDKINVPLRLVYGKLDNYGGVKEDDWLWNRQERCFINADSFIHPKGNASDCNAVVNRGNLTEKPMDWFNSQKAQGANIEMWFYDDAAHGIFLGPMLKNTITYGESNKRFAWVGAQALARDKLLDDISKMRDAK